MRLARVRVVGVGPLADLSVPLAGEDGVPRSVTVVLGGGGTGKTSLLAAIASTRPGYAVALPRSRPPHPGGSFAVTDWVLGRDDPSRPHVLRVTSPQAQLDEPEDVALLRRREQALFDRRAVEGGGFLLVAISGARWFSRTPLLLSAPERTIARYDVRAASSFDDATRADLARETKQAIAWPLVAAALDRGSVRFGAIERVVRSAVNELAAVGGYRLVGIDPASLEPTFERDTGEIAPFDELPTSTRHLVALAALAVKGLVGAHPSADPAEGEGVVLVDDAALHQDAASSRELVPALRRALPNVQWVLATSSVEVLAGCDVGDVLALRRASGGGSVELYSGADAIVH